MYLSLYTYIYIYVIHIRSHFGSSHFGSSHFDSRARLKLKPHRPAPVLRQGWPRGKPSVPPRMRIVARTAGGACCEVSPSDDWTCHDQSSASLSRSSG